MLKKQFELIWDQLRAKKPQMPQYLESIRIKGIRGISDLRVQFPYPVSVIAGPNGCGKSTVLFATAAAYPKQTYGKRFPSELFPNFQAKATTIPSDKSAASEISYVLQENQQTKQFSWSRRSNGRWNRRPSGTEPHRTCYIRTLADLTNPSEIRSVIQMGRQEINPKEVSAALLAFAQRILPNRYQTLIELTNKSRDLLFARLENGASYSEFHMASGERVVLRLSREISQLNDALILIDEVDVGLHPFTQQQLMLELQRIALRNSLQIIVNTHSPVILQSIPDEGRIFLEREDDNVVIRPGWRDVLQRAMYGRPLDRINILCEDKVSKSILQGVMDYLSPILNLNSANFDIGHDTGKDEFQHHIKALGKFQQLSSFIFILDADGRSLENQLQFLAQQMGQMLQLFFLPGSSAPEAWIWDCLKGKTELYSQLLNLDISVLRKEIEQVGRIFESATDKPSEIAKHRLQNLIEGLGRELNDVCRIVACHEAKEGSLVDFRSKIHDAINLWRSREI